MVPPFILEQAVKYLNEGRKGKKITIMELRSAFKKASEDIKHAMELLSKKYKSP